VGAIALGASLVLRFIPVLAQEYRRFSKIVKARSKDRLHREGIGLKQLPPMLIPLILSLFQLASDLTIAMQARGLRSFRAARTSCYQLRMTSADWTVVVLGLLLFALFLWADVVLF
jgi:energy-coupling factor transport system ATP-binding protein